MIRHRHISKPTWFDETIPELWFPASSHSSCFHLVAEVAVVLQGLQVVGVIRATVPVLDATKKPWDDCQVLGVMIKTDR